MLQKRSFWVGSVLAGVEAVEVEAVYSGAHDISVGLEEEEEEEEALDEDLQMKWYRVMVRRATRT